MAKKPPRTWTLVASLGVPLAIVGISAMAISYATLIDVARVNGLPLPELFPVLVDVGTVATMIAAAQFRMRGVPGRWLAYSTFVLLSGVSIVANATHAWRAADLTLTSPWAAAVLASTPPAALLAITHLVMMLVPDERERTKLQAQRERSGLKTHRADSSRGFASPLHAEVLTQGQSEQSPMTTASESPDWHKMSHTKPTTNVSAEKFEHIRDETRQRVLRYLAEYGQRPTGKDVGEWLGGKSPKTGQRFLKQMEQTGDLDGEDSRPLKAA
ncbi:DUF2637 domain-containing protein [Leucobacter chromiireducens]|uniref:DUF2637 domain-containing protein n=2 Tax=Leucobacter TaxID=55968 RepID=A0ABS1SQB5_9MICO|nr:DUF2637 domain-containing protein [Leucobacter chromiireducens]MBL3690358.1 hypothetical protein [Leucobacter chromiireducens subsp. chromiireducens]